MVPSCGKSGGLALFWKDAIKLDVQTYSLTHIGALVGGGEEIGWHLTGFYGDPNTTKRPKYLAKLRHLPGPSLLPWLVIGDFKEPTGISKKEGGGYRPRIQMKNFVDTINLCGLWDIGFVRPKYTWIYQKSNGTQIRERLDHALASPDWVSLFPSAKLFHLSSVVSNHSPLALRLTLRSRKQRMGKAFRFESMWLKDP